MHAELIVRAGRVAGVEMQPRRLRVFAGVGATLGGETTKVELLVHLRRQGSILGRRLRERARGFARGAESRGESIGRVQIFRLAIATEREELGGLGGDEELGGVAETLVALVRDLVLRRLAHQRLRLGELRVALASSLEETRRGEIELLLVEELAALLRPLLLRRRGAARETQLIHLKDALDHLRETALGEKPPHRSAFLRVLVVHEHPRARASHRGVEITELLEKNFVLRGIKLHQSLSRLLVQRARLARFVRSRGGVGTLVVQGRGREPRAVRRARVVFEVVLDVEVVEASPLLGRGRILEEIVQHDVLKLQTLRLEHRAHETDAPVLLEELSLRLFRAHDETLLRAELDLGVVLHRAEHQHPEIFKLGRVEQPRAVPLEQTHVRVELIDGVREELAQHAHEQVGDVEDAAVRAKIIDELVHA